MSEERFREPKITINKVYTRSGDSGETGLVGGQRVAKDHVRIEAYGDVDELNATIGGCREAIKDYIDRYAELTVISDILHRIQHELFNTGTILATMPSDITADLPCITESDIKRLEDEMDRFRVEVGHRDRVKPGNLVGAIANEAGLKGRSIGRIRIFDNYSLVDLPKQMPDKVFQALKKVKVMNRELQINRTD